MTTAGQTPAAGAAETPRTPEQRLDAIESVLMEVIDKVEKLSTTVTTVQKTAVTKPKGLFGGKRTPTPMKDIKTGLVHASKAALGKALAAEAGADPADTMAYYTVIKVLKMPDGTDRFTPASPEEAAKARAEYDAKVKKTVDEMNAKLEAEREAATKAAPAAAPAAQPNKNQPKKK